MDQITAFNQETIRHLQTSTTITASLTKITTQYFFKINVLVNASNIVKPSVGKMVDTIIDHLAT